MWICYGYKLFRAIFL